MPTPIDWDPRPSHLVARWLPWTLAFPYYVLFGAYVITAVQVVTILAALQLMAAQSIRRFGNARPRDAVSVAVYAYCSAGAASILVAENYQFFFRAAARTMGIVLTFWVVRRAVRTPQAQIRLLRALVTAGSVAAVAFLLGALWYRWNGPDISLQFDDLRRSGGLSPFGNSNPVGGFFAMVLPIALAFALRRDASSARRVIPLIVLSTGLLATGSRSAFVAACVGVAATVSTGKKGTSSRRWAVVTAIVFGLFVFALPSVLMDRLQTGWRMDDYNSASRYLYWVVAFRVFAAHPILGIGLGNFLAVEPHTWLSSVDLSSVPVSVGLYALEHAHNVPLTVAAETGVLGLTALTGAMAAGIRAAFKGSTARERPVNRAIGAALLSFVAFGFFEYPLTLSSAPTAFALLAVVTTRDEGSGPRPRWRV